MWGKVIFGTLLSAALLCGSPAKADDFRRDFQRFDQGQAFQQVAYRGYRGFRGPGVRGRAAFRAPYYRSYRPYGRYYRAPYGWPAYRGYAYPGYRYGRYGYGPGVGFGFGW